MKPAWYIPAGILVITLGIRINSSGSFGKYEQFPVPTVTGWIVIAWGALCIAYGLLQVIQRRRTKKDTTE